MKEFFRQSMIFIGMLLLPFILLVILYIYFDPFQVVKDNESFHYNPIEPNRDFVSTEHFMAKKDTYHYNSYIFGSSRAISYKVDSWVNFLENDPVPFAYDAAGESLYGIYRKILLLEKEDVDLDNVLILFCRNGFYNIENHSNRLSIKHPEVSGESWITFHFVHFNSYLNLKFLLGYYSYLITNKENRFTSGIIQNKGITIDSVTNQIFLNSLEEELRKNLDEYYESRKNLFYQRKGESYEENFHIEKIHMEMLTEIKNILEKNNSNYKVVLNPIYDQVKFSIKDKEKLVKVFGDHLFDFTGKNFITENDTNWYEVYHFKPYIADSILSIIYSPVDSIKNKWR